MAFARADQSPQTDRRLSVIVATLKRLLGHAPGTELMTVVHPSSPLAVW